MNHVSQIEPTQLGKLRRIQAFAEFEDTARGPNMRFDEIQLEFENSSLFISVDVDDDTVVVSAGGRGFRPVSELTNAAAFSTCIGLSLRWVWTLKNHRGYVDGIQAEFAGDAQSCIVQFLAEASELSCLAVIPIKSSLG